MYYCFNVFYVYILYYFTTYVLHLAIQLLSASANTGWSKNWTVFHSLYPVHVDIEKHSIYQTVQFFFRE